jgi:hypothetical protein
VHVHADVPSKRGHAQAHIHKSRTPHARNKTHLSNWSMILSCTACTLKRLQGGVAGELEPLRPDLCERAAQARGNKIGSSDRCLGRHDFVESELVSSSVESADRFIMASWGGGGGRACVEGELGVRPARRLASKPLVFVLQPPSVES